MFRGRNAPFLQKGDTGELVEVVQDALNRGGYYIGEKRLDTDGYYGPHTEAAAKAFQKLQDLRATGKLTRRDFHLLIRPYKLTLNSPQQVLASENKVTSSRSSDLFTIKGLAPLFAFPPTGQHIALIFGIAIILAITAGYAVRFRSKGREVEFIPPPIEQPDSEATL